MYDPILDDPFLVADGVKTDTDAMKMSLSAALQRNKTYRDGIPEWRRDGFRREWARLIRQASARYTSSQVVSDDEHCKSILNISDVLTQTFGASLIEGRLRFGTSQKAFNLYLKYLWRLGRLAMPPHCPIDAIVLSEAGIPGSWTHCDSEKEYMAWVNRLRSKAHPKYLAEWEYDVWLRRALQQRSAASGKCS